MWKFTNQQRISQKELLSRIGKILFISSFLIFLGSLFAFSVDFTFPFVESIMFFSQFSIYLGAVLVAIATFLTWNSSPFWDFIFNQSSIFLIVIGFGIAWWNTMHDKPVIHGIIIVWIAFGLIGLGRRFDSSRHLSLDNSNVANKSPNLKFALLKAIKTAAIGLCVSAIIGACFTGLLFGFNASALLVGATFGGLIGLFFGALIGALVVTSKLH